MRKKGVNPSGTSSRGDPPETDSFPPYALVAPAVPVKHHSGAPGLPNATGAEPAATDSSDLFRTLLEATPDALLMIDTDGKIELCNQQAEALFGYAREELVGQKIEMLMPERFWEVHVRHRYRYQVAPHVRAMGQGRVFRALSKNGIEFPVEISLSPLHAGDGSRVICTVRDVTERVQYEEQLRAQMLLIREYTEELESRNRSLVEANRLLEDRVARDSLTGLFNHRMFHEMVEREFQRAMRGQIALSLIMLDVDHFKQYNDTFGHPAGDQVLQKLAAILVQAIRSSDVAARCGGEEFGILLPDTGATEACLVAERLRHQILKQAWSHRPITASFGAATLTLEVGSAQELIRMADQALYTAKRAGRNRIVHARNLQKAPLD
ncbi:MAG: diguanylate cyclase [Chthonomonadaceae bacterium]|nr:diguanylate cyclase [Chthonomonadaceae bacterium]